LRNSGVAEARIALLDGHHLDQFGSGSLGARFAVTGTAEQPLIFPFDEILGVRNGPHKTANLWRNMVELGIRHGPYPKYGKS